ncbi:RNA chaperone ProQ [Psychromonas aquatilis]|uniref:RNA chaperone ProQ n=1 Tax=Psychromonas aquatilis TaxID=2005072 RepID=A0ABU9GNN4_9GAMM
MENTEKFTNNKQIITFLTEQFPACFIAGSESAKPLKIGVFQDLAARLENEPRVSKTQLRGALRQYTMSWRYLHCVKVGVKRVDLDGVEGEEVSQEHADHAQQSLKESKEKAFANKKKTDAKKAPARAAKKVSIPNRKKADTKKPAKKAEIDLSQFKEATHSELKVSQPVKVLLGKSPVSATVVEILKEEVQVQLDSGMVVKVKAKHLIV